MKSRAPSRRRRLPAPEARARILDAAEARLASGGPEAIRLQDIAADLEISFDLVIRDKLLLVFFATIGLSAKLRTLAAGGKALAILVVVAAVFLVFQNATGVGLAVLLGAHPGYGLMGGSVSFAAGHQAEDAIVVGQVRHHGE